MKRYVNSLFFKIACTVTAGILFLSAVLMVMNIMMSKDIFVDHFAESQQKIFEQIDREFYDFYEDVASIMTSLEKSSILDTYLYRELDSKEKMKNSYELERQLQETKIGEYSDLTMLVIGENYKSYISNDSDRFSVPKEEVLESSAARKAREHRGQLICQYEKQGFTWVTQTDPVVVFAKAWMSKDGKQDTCALIMIKESTIKEMYSAFTVTSNDIILLNQDDQVVSSDNPLYLQHNGEANNTLYRIVKRMEEKMIYQSEEEIEGSRSTCLLQRLQGTNYKILGMINSEKAFQERYKFAELTFLTLGVLIFIVCAVFLFVRQQTKPLSRLAEAMQNSRNTKYKEHVAIEGTYEVRELSETYNDMVDELEQYIENLIQVEKDKRAAEIHTLQMQINPHYIYNTLASIKWLIWQGDTKKSTDVLDAFIALLRNTISNTDEYVTVDQEIENLKHYVLINQTRYGDAVQVEFYLTPQSGEYKVPKLVLQPFVENAFFHGFPEGRKGKIQIFVREDGDSLRFDIQDNGIGIKPEQLVALNNGRVEKSEHFTGIGVGNVDQRLKLIYGVDYGIHINSEEGKGTTVTLILPKMTQ